MPEIYERIPLVVPRSFSPHPWNDRLCSSELNGIRAVDGISRQAIQLRRREFHIVDPVVLLIEIGSAARRGLADTRVAIPCCVCIDRLRPKLSRQGGIDPLQNNRS